MHFATFLPDWNSLESVRHAHSSLEGAALVFFALLVLFDVLAHLSEDKDKNRARLFEKIGLCFFAIAVLAEIAAYPYGQRNDKLSEDMIGSLSDKAAQAEVKARKALTDSGTALIKAGEAKEVAGDALVKSKAANDAAGKALDKSSAAISAVGKAQEKVGAVAKEADDLLQKYLSTEAKLEAERDTRVDLERTIAPRLIPRIIMRGCASNIDSLKRVKGYSVRIIGITDWEARRAASNLVGIFKNARWKVEGDVATALEQNLPDGVTVEAFMPSEAENDSAGISREWEAEDIAETVVDFLEANGWQATFGYSQRGELQPHEIKILVGFKPAPYFSPYKLAPSKRALQIKAQIDDLMNEDNVGSSWSPNMLMEPTKANKCPE